MKIPSVAGLLALSLVSLAAPVHAQSDAQSDIQTKPFSEIAVSREFRFPASVVTLQYATIAAEGNGRIIDFPWLEGDRVERGQTLLRLDCRDAELQLDRARAGLKRLRASRELTELELERARGLVKSRSISRAELDQREAQLRTDNAGIEEQQASIAASEEMVKDCTLQAPFDGVITERLVSVGGYAATGMAVLKLLKTDAVEVQLEIPLDRVATLRSASAIRYHSNGTDYPLQIRRVLPFIDNGSLQQKVRLAFTGDIRPPGGSFGHLTFTSAAHYLPASYVQKRDARFGVFVAREGKAHFVPLQNAAEGQAVEARLEADEEVIVSGLKQLKPGDSLEAASGD